MITQVYSLLKTSWGHLGVVAQEDALVGLHLPATRGEISSYIQRRWPLAVGVKSAMPELEEQLHAYFSGKRTSFRVKVALDAVPPFRKKVYEACRKIPYGKTASYRDLAGMTGSPGASRAVGGAMANNPIPLVIPCHRVLRSDGSIGGFSSPQGISQKIRLLELEGTCASRMPRSQRLQFAERGT